MPQAVVIAGIGAAAGLGGGAIAARASGQASKSHSKAADQALAFEREREAARQAEYRQAQAMQRAAWEAREANRLAMLRRYGVNVPLAPTAAPTGASPRLSSLIRNPDPRVRLAPDDVLEPVAPKRTGSFADLSSRWHQWGGR